MAGLTAGKGDIAGGTLTVTPARQAIVDFAAPWSSGVKEVLVTGPASTDVKSIDDLGDRPIMVRSSSSYRSHLVELNKTRKAAGKPGLIIKPADENLEDEDLLEMVGTGMLPFVVVDRFKAKAWARCATTSSSTTAATSLGRFARTALPCRRNWPNSSPRTR